MTKLIKDSVFNKIRKVLNDVQETFYQSIAIYKRDNNSVDTWGEDTEGSRAQEAISINVLVVWSSSKEDAQALRALVGGFSGNLAYANVSYDEALAKGLIDGSKTIVYKPIADKIEVDGENFTVLGIVKLGQLKDTEVVVKIIFTKDVVEKK